MPILSRCLILGVNFNSARNCYYVEMDINYDLVVQNET